MTDSRKHFHLHARKILLASILALFAVGEAIAKPPPWAPAHGYRAKQDLGYRSAAIYLPWHGRAAHSDYIIDGRCNRDKLGAVIGGIVGGAAGSQIGKGDGRTLATIAGTVIGIMVGQSIGRHMDETDQNCTGQVLEYADNYEAVSWKDPDGSSYTVTPTRTYEPSEGRYCREYRTDAIIDGRKEQLFGKACRQPDGSWEKI